MYKYAIHELYKSKQFRIYRIEDVIEQTNYIDIKVDNNSIEEAQYKVRSAIINLQLNKLDW